MAKHFNSGNVWGAVMESFRKNTRKGVPFLMIKIDCSGENGSFYVYGRLWGQLRIDGLIEHIRAHPGETIRFRGFFEQYTREVAYWNYTFYSWEPAAGKPRKAAFVLRGEITDNAIEKDREGRVSIRVLRPGKNGYQGHEDHIDLYTSDPGDVTGMCIGETWEIKGYIKQGGGEDEFGVAAGLIRPYAEVMKKVEDAGHDA